MVKAVAGWGSMGNQGVECHVEVQLEIVQTCT